MAGMAQRSVQMNGSHYFSGTEKCRSYIEAHLTPQGVCVCRRVCDTVDQRAALVRQELWILLSGVSSERWCRAKHGGNCSLTKWDISWCEVLGRAQAYVFKELNMPETKTLAKAITELRFVLTFYIATGKNLCLIGVNF